jgi:predicted lysophospholipase L1 biosynthesis ABC-type transport system permease subunit
VRISRLPYLLAALITFLAVASLAHALTSSIRRSRHDLAVWKTLGFTRRQVRTAVAWHATELSVSATAIGIPLGILLGRVGWRAVAGQIGVASPPSTPLLPIIGAVVGALVAANVIAAYPGWRAAVFPTGRALQAE